MREAQAETDAAACSSATAWRAPRTAIATLVSVGFIVFAVGMSALPPTTSPSTPHTRDYGSATEVPSSVSPMRMVPM